jgi:hypothetical protein
MRTLSSIALSTVLAATASAQCITVTGVPVTLFPSTPFWSADDEGLSAPEPLGFGFPLGAATWTHVVIESNGALYLTNGGPPIGATNYGFADMSGVAGDSPRVAATWADLEGIAAGYEIRIDTSIPNQCKIVWVNVSEYGTGAQAPFRMQAVLHAAGLVEISVGPNVGFQWYTATVGVSEANGIFATSSDLSTGPVSATLALYEDFFSPSLLDLANTTTSFLPTAGPGFTAVTTCVGPPPAAHVPYGTGCYAEFASFYEYLDTGTFDLSGTGVTMLLSGGYAVLPPLTSYVPPSPNATTLVLQDDDETSVTLGAPFPYAGGTTTSLAVCSNGYVSAASNGANSYPDVFLFLDMFEASWHSWHDFDPSSGGAVKFEEIGGVAYFTWDGVFTYGTTTPETMQMQFDTNTGAVHIHWVSISGQGTPYLVGYSPGGSSLDPGSIDLTSALPLTTFVADLPPLVLSANPPPISTATTGTLVTYTVDNAHPNGPGQYVGVLVLSNGQIPPPGIDLANLLGAPGCAQYITSLDVLVPMFSGTPTLQASFNIPPGIPLFTFYGQAVALFVPGTLPNGQNPGGFLSSNGIETTVSIH